MPAFGRKTDELIEANPELFEKREERRSPRTQKQTPEPKAAPKSGPKEAPRKFSQTMSRWKIRTVRHLAQAGMIACMLPLAMMGATIGGLAAWLDQAPPLREFDEYNPPEATMILDAEGEPLAALYEQQRYVVSIDELPPDLVYAFIAIEDERFFQHFGIDFLGITRAMGVNILRGKLSQGASTITQQTARNLLARIGTEKSIVRKLREMLVAVQMEHQYSKEQIIEVYLNQIYLGSGTYGVEAAARTYFGKSAAELRLPECAALAGLPQLPERYSPLNNPDLTVRRRDRVLAKMWELGYISSPDYDSALASVIELNPVRVSRSAAPYFLDAVRRQLADHPELGGSSLQTAGWQVRTTIDPELQRIAEETLRAGLEREEVEWLKGRQERYTEAQQEDDFERAPASGQIRMGKVVGFFSESLVVELPGGWRADLSIPEGAADYFREGEYLGKGDGIDVYIEDVVTDRGLFKGSLLPRQKLQGALVAMDPATGEVRALVGGRDFNDRANNGYYNRAVQARRQAGSTMKPFFFAAGLEQGMTPHTSFHDRRIIFPDGYTPRNYENMYFGRTSMQTALEHSRNIVTILLVQEVGLQHSLDFVRQFQRTGSKPWSLPLEWPVVLGTTGVTPLELTAAYQPLANAGEALGPRMIKTIRTEDGRITDAPNVPEPEHLLTRQTSAYMLQMMIGTMGHGTGDDLRETMPDSLKDKVAGKTGTTNENRDAWFAGFSPTDVAVVWVGFDQLISLGPGRTGSKAAGPIWAEYMTKAWEHHTADGDQPEWKLPSDYVMAAVKPGDEQLLMPEDKNWIEPPYWRVYTTDEYAWRLEQRERRLNPPQMVRPAEKAAPGEDTVTEVEPEQTPPESQETAGVFQP